jgi:hypothetical protein
VSAYREGDRTVVMIPARMTRAEEKHWVALMVERLAKQDRRRRPDDDELLARARDLSRRHLGGRAKPASVRWVTNQGSRWGSCTPVDGSIRLSSRLQLGSTSRQTSTDRADPPPRATRARQPRDGSGRRPHREAARPTRTTARRRTRR